MQFFKQLTDPALKRLYKFVLKRLIGRFLAEDEIDLDQLDVHLRSGRLELCDLLLNADVLNSELCEAHGLPFRVKKGYLGSVRVTISYTNIMSESCLVEIDDIEIVLVPVSEMGAEAEVGGESTSNAAARSVGGARGNEAGKAGKSEANQAVGITTASSGREHMDEISQEGLDFVASWIEQVTSKIKVTLSNICLRLETGDKLDGKSVALLCKLEWAQFTDESASEVASVYGRGGMEQSFGPTSQSMHQSMAASSLFGISQKGVKFRGISMDLSLPSEDGDVDDPVLHPFLASDSTRQCYVQVKVSHYEALDAPAVDADLFFHSIRVVLQPQHFPQFGLLMEAFGDEHAPPPTAAGADRYTGASMYKSICDSRPNWLNDDDEAESDSSGGALKLSFREFQRIEQLLQQYQKTHEELMSVEKRSDMPSAALDQDLPYPVPRRLSIVESVESVGLSDLEDEESFFECDPGAESISGNVHFAGGASNLMAQSMYASAMYEPEEDHTSATSGADGKQSLRSSVRHRPSRNVQNRVKIHLLECDVVVLYDDLPDLEEEDHGFDRSLSSRERHLRRRRKGLPEITSQERLEFRFKDLISTTLIYQNYVTVSLTIGTFEIVEIMLARMSTDIVEDESALLTTSVLRFVDFSPVSGRKVHLSANISAQLRLDFGQNDGQSTESLALQVSAQPILLEWDMYMLDRAHRLMKLLEESSAAKQKKNASSPAPSKDPPFPKKLDINTECFEITLRFPMISSDLIRFGPSSKRGLSEDKLVLNLESVKVSSYADIEQDGESPTTNKVPLTWMSDFAIRFDTVSVSLTGPRGGIQRSTLVDKYLVLTGRGDISSGDTCGLRLRLQTPSSDEVRLAMSAKHKLAKDSLENLDSAVTISGFDDAVGDDNDGGRVGSNGWNQDARGRAVEFEVAASSAALFDLNISIPQSKVVFTKASFDRLMILFDALLSISPIDINGHNQMMSSTAYRNRLIPSYMTVNVTLSDGTIQLQHTGSGESEWSKTPATPSSIYHFAFQDLRVFQVSQWMGQLVSRVHVAAQNMTLLEEDCSTQVVNPILYKNPIGVVDAPILFVGIDIIDQTQEMREMKVDLHVSQVNLRYDVTSKWLMQLLELLVLEYPSPIISLDSASTSDEEYLDVLKAIETMTYDTVKLAVAPKTVFTKLFVSFYDAIADYAPANELSRVMIVLGNVRLSSNVVTGAMIQGYKISVRDIQIYLTPERPGYDEVDPIILGHELFAQGAKGIKKGVNFASDSRSRGRQASPYPSLLVFFEKYGFLQIVTMDCIDLFLRAIVPVEQTKLGSSGLLENENKATPASLGSPELSVELNLGTANIYACFDSFNTLIQIASVWADQLDVEAEPRDTTAYVGLDRVKDLSSVSVVTNLGPSTVRATRTLSEDASVPSNTTGGSMAKASRRSSLRTVRPQRSERPSTQMSDGSGGSSVAPGINILAEIDENAFGSSRRKISGKHATTDTEARLLRTRLDEIQREKNRIVGGLEPVDRDDMLSGAELRRKYKVEEQEKPRIRINELVIEDYYNGNRSSGICLDASGTGGDFLLEAKEAEPSVNTSDSPWFSTPMQIANRDSALGNGSHPVGSLPDEHTACWLAPGFSIDSPSIAGGSGNLSPQFDPVDEDALIRELSTLDRPAFNVHAAAAAGLGSDGDEDGESEDEDEEGDMYASGAFPAGPKNWWGMETRPDVELSELQTEETGSTFSHHVPFMDDESTRDEASSPHPLSMSMIGTGEDEGTEVELDFALDREMQFNFNRLMDIESSDGQYVEDDEADSEEEDEKAVSPPPMSMKARPTSPLPIPSRSSSDQLFPSVPAIVQPTISPPDEPTARWFYDDATGDNDVRDGPPSRIYPHHVEIPIGGTAASLSFGEKECDEAIRAIARENAAMRTTATAPVVVRHILLRDFNICMRFFGGSDWSRDAVNAPTLTHRGLLDASRRETPVQSSTSSTAINSGDGRKEKLLDALLDNYVPSSGSDLFGSESDSSKLFGKAGSAPARSHMASRVVAPVDTSFRSNSDPPSRKRSLKSGRKTEEMLELVITKIQLRVDMFNEDENQPLASNTVVALGDIEILDYISTSQIRKIICYWKSDVTHPRESGSSMVHVHLMTVRPGRNLCEEHRLKMKLLPLRVNLDQEVVNFLRQFVPTEDSRHTNFAGESIPDDDDDGVSRLDGTELATLSAPAPSRVTETDVSLGNWFFQNIEVRPCKIKIDYRPNRVDYQALRAGDYLEVINLFVLEGMELVLRRVKASGIDGWGALGEHVLMSWVNDISRHQIHKCVASVSMPPLRSFANVGSGAADLILLPLEHYGKDRRIVRGLKKGAKSFLKSVTIETLNTASKFALGTQALLEHADDVVSSSASRKKQIKYRQPGSRIARNSRRMGGGGIRNAQDRGGIGSRQYLAQQPSNATEGFYQAYDSLSRELHVAAKTIVAVPLVEYKKTGSQGYVRSVIRAVPVAVLRPMIGASEAMSKALIGVRNAVDPELKEDVENKFKDFRTI